MNVCFLFPGQGSQSPGMLARLPEHPLTIKTLKEASDHLKCDLNELDSESSLHFATSLQLSLFIAGVASARALQAEGIKAIAVAGMSIGAFSAAVISGTLRFDDGLDLVKKRARLMEQKYPTGYGMTAVIGLSEARLRKLLDEIRSGGEQVFLSNINGPIQITVSGTNSGLSKVEERVLEIGARKVERLNINVPSHCELFRNEANLLHNAFANIKLSPPIVPYISNIRARTLRKSDAIAHDLANNIAHGVRWYDTLSVAIELGSNLFIEMAPGSVLTKMANSLYSDTNTVLRFISLQESSLSYLKNLSSRNSTY